MNDNSNNIVNGTNVEPQVNPVNAPVNPAPVAPQPVAASPVQPNPQPVASAPVAPQPVPVAEPVPAAPVQEQPVAPAPVQQPIQPVVQHEEVAGPVLGSKVGKTKAEIIGTVIFLVIAVGAAIWVAKNYFMLG